MFYNIVVAFIGTFIVFIGVEFVKSVRQFLIFKRVRDVVFESIFDYLRHTPQRYIDLAVLRENLMKQLADIKLSSWVEDIKLSWDSVDAILFVFELNFEKLKPKYRFVIGLKDVEKFMQRM